MRSPAVAHQFAPATPFFTISRAQGGTLAAARARQAASTGSVRQRHAWHARAMDVPRLPKLTSPCRLAWTPARPRHPGSRRRFDDGDALPCRHGPALAHQHFGHDSSGWTLDADLHLHRLDDHDRVALLNP